MVGPYLFSFFFSLDKHWSWKTAQKTIVNSHSLKDFDFKSFDDMINSSGLFEENTSLPSLITRYDVVLRDTSSDKVSHSS